MFQQMNPDGCLNLNPDAISVLEILSYAMRNVWYRTNNMPMFLSTLSRLEVPVFLGSVYPAKIERRVHILPNSGRNKN